MTSGDPDSVRSRDFGRRLAAHRAQRRQSQLQLGLPAGVSARHISFLETGRASPSRDMVRRLAEALALPLAAHDALLVAAGHAPRDLRCGDILDRSIAIQSAATDELALDLTRAGLAALGLARFFVGVLTPAARGATPLVAFGDLRHAPTDWMAHYRTRGFRRDDPFMRATAFGTGPFFWPDVLRRRPVATPRERQIVNEARAFGVTTGFVMPTRMPDGRVFAVSAMGDGVDADDPRVRWEARLLTAATLDRVTIPQGAPG